MISLFTWLCYMSLMCQFMHACNCSYREIVSSLKGERGKRDFSSHKQSKESWNKRGLILFSHSWTHTCTHTHARIHTIQADAGPSQSWRKHDILSSLRHKLNAWLYTLKLVSWKYYFPDHSSIIILANKYPIGL